MDNKRYFVEIVTLKNTLLRNKTKKTTFKMNFLQTCSPEDQEYKALWIFKLQE